MEFTTQFDEEEALTFQLYAASTSPRIRKTRLREWIFTVVTFGLLAYLFFRNNIAFLQWTFGLFALLSIFLFPYYSRWRYKKHYRNYIRDVYKNKLGERFTLTLDKDSIFTKDRAGESRINITEIEAVHELKDHIILTTHSGIALTIPKHKTENIDQLLREIKSLAETQHLPYINSMQWKWR